MSSTPLYRRLNTVFHSSRGDYEVFVCARTRRDQRWEGLLEFRPVSGDGTIATNVQTTQNSAAAVFDWAKGLTASHIEGSFAAAVAPRPRQIPGIASLPTPPRSSDRLAHLRPIERDVLDFFKAAGATRVPTAEIFARGPHSNADYVRAFEDLEKQGRYLVRHTTGGTDWIELTLDGAAALGIPARPAGKIPAELPKSAR